MDTTVLTELIGQYGYLGIALLIALENIFPPIPSEVVLTFTGFLTLTAGLNVLGAITAATIGAVLGATILYAVGHFLSVERLEKLLNGKLGQTLRFKAKDLNKATNFFQKNGILALFFGRFVPVVRSLISVPAGMTHYKFTSFIILTTLGTLIWNTVLIFVGRMAGSAWPQIVAMIETYSLVTVIILALAFVGGGFYFFNRKKA